MNNERIKSVSNFIWSVSQVFFQCFDTYVERCLSCKTLCATYPRGSLPQTSLQLYTFTSPLVLPPGDLEQTYASFLIVVHLLHYGKT